MFKRISLLINTILFSLFCASAQDIYVVQQFGNNLSSWANGGKEFIALQNFNKLCSKNPSFRAADDIMQSLARKNGLVPSQNYDLDNYITCLQKEINSGVSITISNISNVPSSEISKPRVGFQYVSCNIQISGATNMKESALFLIKDNKVANIQNYVVSTNNSTGKRKIEVDWSGLDIDEDTEGFGVSYNYSKAFPFGASITYSKWKFMIGVDFGINNDKDIYTTQKVYFNNIVDYKIDRGEYDLKYFITATPSFYMKYFSVGWGVGYAYLKGTKYTMDNNLTVYPDGTTIQTGSTTSVDDFKYKWMMRPTIKGYIPCSDNFFISLSVNYDWIIGYKEKSGIGFGAGIHFLFD